MGTGASRWGLTGTTLGVWGDQDYLKVRVMAAIKPINLPVNDTLVENRIINLLIQSVIDSDTLAHVRSPDLAYVVSQLRNRYTLYLADKLYWIYAFGSFDKVDEYQRANNTNVEESIAGAMELWLRDLVTALWEQHKRKILNEADLLIASQRTQLI